MQKTIYKFTFGLISIICLISVVRAEDVSCSYAYTTTDSEVTINTIIYLDSDTSGSVSDSDGHQYYYGNNNATVYSSAQCIDCFFSTDYYEQGDDMVQDWAKSNSGGCPPYFHVYSDIGGNATYYGYFSDVENPKDNDAHTNPHTSFKLTKDSNVKENEEGQLTPIAEKHACNYSAIVNRYGNFETTITINTSDNVLYLSDGYFESKKDYEKANQFKPDECPSDLFACFEPTMNNSTVNICSKADIANGYCNVSSTDNYCRVLNKTDKEIEIGTNGCRHYYDNLGLYNEKLFNGDVTGANEIKSKMKNFCKSIFKFSNWDNYEYSCIQMCNNIHKDYGDKTLQKGYECGFSEKLIQWIANIIRWVKYIVPVAVIVLGILDFMKAIGADKEDEMKKAQQRFIRRLIAAALIFIAPFIIEFILNKLGFDANGCGIINL